MLLPDNFLYFISVFFLSTLAGAYLLFSYKRNWLLVINALLFFLVAIRAATEHYLPQIELFENAKKLTIFHSLVAHIITVGIWYVTWYYIRPFRGWKKEKLINHLIIWFVLILPNAFFIYGHLNRRFYRLHPEKIDGFWQFTTTPDSLLSVFYFLYAFYLISFFTKSALIVDIVRAKKNRIKKLFVLIIYLVFPFIFSKFLVSNTSSEYIIPNIAPIYFGILLATSWFVSNYRLFQDNFSKTLKDLLESVSDLAIFTDTQLRISHTNHLAVEQFSTNITHKNINKVLSDASQESSIQIQQFIDELINQQIKEKEIELHLNGVDKIFNLKVAKFEEGNLHLGYTFLLTDLTDVKQKEQELIQSNTTKDRLFAIIGHDLRKPALAFRGISKKVNFLIQEKEFETLNKFGEGLEKSAFALNGLLDNLLNWALQQRKVLPYNPKPINIAEATTEIYSFFQQFASEKGVQMQLDVNATETVFSDINSFNTIMRNLVDNALKFTPKGGKIAISAQKINDKIALKIKDTGMGIPPEQMTQIFDLQYNKSRQGTNGEKGSGLGLTLIRDLVALNKGEIKVESQVDKGTTFEVLLPAA